MSEIINFKEQIRRLAQLQALDTQIYALKREKEQFPIKVAALEKDFNEKKAVLDSSDEKAKQLAVRRKEKELDLAFQEENIKKFNNQLFSLKTNKEYQAMLGQIAGLKTDTSLIEEDVLKIMEEQDILKAQLDKEKAVLAEEEKKVLSEKKTIEERIKEIDYSLNELFSKRNQACESIDKRILAHYERILKAKDGLAIVKVINNACQGCFINVTHQVINEIKMQEKIITCEVCARMLYIEEDL